VDSGAVTYLLTKHFVCLSVCPRDDASERPFSRLTWISLLPVNFLSPFITTAHVTNQEVRSRTGQPPDTSLLKS